MTKKIKQGAETSVPQPTMSREDAKLRVQTILANAEKLLAEAGELMDQHQFSVSFLEVQYIPRQMRFIDVDSGKLIDPDDGNEHFYAQGKGDELCHLYFDLDRYQYLAGKWKSSGDWRDC